MDYRKLASRYRELGMVVIPVDENKQPKNVSWHFFQDRQMEDWEIEKHFKDCEGLGLLTGGEYGIEALDCDVKYFPSISLMTELKELIGADLMKKLVVQQTKSGGFHFIYRCAEAVEGNQKLAMRETTEKEVRDELFRQISKTNSFKQSIKTAMNYKALVLFETRGGTKDKRGGYILIAPSKGYQILQGDLSNIPIISVEERNHIIECARSLNQYKDFKKDFRMVSLQQGEKGVFDIFNENNVGLDILLEHGWTIDEETSRGKDVRLLRPGHTNSKNSGIFDRDTNCFTCFSSSTSFEVNKGYSPANLYIELVCDGDVVRAFKELTEMVEK